MSIPDKPLLTLPQYRALVRSLPRPTLIQMQQFALLVSHAHSWYKRLPYLPPGAPFQFFLDPGAGMKLTVSRQGSVDARPHAKCGFHDSGLSTAEYRDQFGYLAYSWTADTSFAQRFGRGPRRISSDTAPFVYDFSTHSLCPLPAPVLEAGRAFVSGVAHPGGTDARCWKWMDEAKTRVDWPEESGGSEAVARIVARSRVLEEDPSRIEYVKRETVDRNQYSDLLFVDYPLYQLLEPERQRQRAGMMAAMTRVIELVNRSAD